MVQQTINLYAWRENEKMIPPVLITQGESDTRTATFRLLDQATTIDLTGKSVSFEYDKPDGFHVSLVCQPTENPGECTCTFSDQAAIAPGIVNDTRVMVRSGTDVLEILGPRLYIANGINANAIVSSSEFATLSAYISDLSTYYQQVAAVQSGLQTTNVNLSNLQETVTNNKSEIDGEISSLQSTDTQLQQSITTFGGNLTAHTGNSTIHVTQEEKNQWNASISPGDYVTEEGTSGGWSYRKWNSGIAECWGLFTQTVEVTNVWDSGNVLKFGIGQSENFPFTFSSIPYLNFSLLNYPNFFILSHQGAVSATATFIPCVISVNSYESVSCQFGFYAIGNI